MVVDHCNKCRPGRLTQEDHCQVWGQPGLQSVCMSREIGSAVWLKSFVFLSWKFRSAREKRKGYGEEERRRAIGGDGWAWARPAGTCVMVNVSLEHGFLSPPQEHGSNGNGEYNEAVSGLKAVVSEALTPLWTGTGVSGILVSRSFLTPRISCLCLLLTKWTLNFLLFLIHSLELRPVFLALQL